jgi:hypothetical protein
LAAVLLVTGSSPRCLIAWAGTMRALANRQPDTTDQAADGRQIRESVYRKHGPR